MHTHPDRQPLERSLRAPCPAFPSGPPDRSPASSLPVLYRRPLMSARTKWLALMLVLIVIGLSSCEYVRLLRPSVLSQLNPRVVQMVNYLPAADHPNEAILARLFVHGGLSHAERGMDGVFRDEILVPKNEFIWQPAVI